VAGTTSWSAECYRIFGMPPEEGGASREAFDERVHPDDRQMVMAALDQAAAAHEAYVLDHRLLLPDGTMKWVQGHCEFVYDSAGTVCGSIGTLQDITERKNAEVVLQRSEQLSRMASTLGQIGGWDVDLVTGAIEWSPEVAKIHGTAPDYRPTLDEGIHFYAPESRSLIRDSVTRCINEATPFDVEAQIVNTSGERVWVRVMAEAVANPSGKVIGFRGAIQNITERMRTMQTLRETDQRFRLVALATSDVVWDWDAASNKTWWSDGLQVKFGHVVKPSVDLWAEALHPEDRERVLAGLAASIASGEPWSDEYRFRKGDGSYVRISDRAFSALDENGKVCRMVGAMVDVTEQRMLEARLEQAQRVSTLGQMAANMAHEFNNVLMGIQPFMEVLRRLTADIPKAQNATARIAESVQRGKQITDEILRYAREAEPVANPIRIRDWFAGYSAKNVGAGSPSPAVPAAEPAVPPVRSRAKTVLIIDDESTVADGICMLLASEAVHAHAIQTGEEAIGAIERHAPDVVMLDIGLPDISGVEVFHRIHGRWADLRVVLMTGHYGRGDLDSILVLPHVRFLQKPFGIEELLEVLQW
jgi:PAS domain S-box-containing protein